MCECYQIGGEFIGADPDCPIHGDNGVGEQIERLIEAWNALPDELRFDPRLDRLAEVVRTIGV